MDELKRLLVEELSDHPDFCREVIMFLFVRCDSHLVVVDSNEQSLVRESITFPVHFANMDYSRSLVVYGEKGRRQYMIYARNL
jgi:hypothetical protein